MKKQFLPLIAGCALALALLSPLAPRAIAAPDSLTFNVDDTADKVDAAPGDGKCRTAAGTCTLRAAIMEANKHKGTDVIKLQPNAVYKLTRVGQDDNAKKGDLDVSDSINLIGNGAKIDANGAVTQDRVFQFLPFKDKSYVSQLENIILTGGSTAGDGGAILNGAYLRLKNVVVSSNHAGGKGGGIANFYIVFAQDSTVTTNDCACPSAAQPGGGGIFNQGAFFMSASTVSGNTSHFDGGGIWSQGTVLQLLASTVTSNFADRHGGAIYTSSQNVDIAHSTIARNFADLDNDNVGDAGGIYVQAGTTTLGHTILGDNFNIQQPNGLKADDCRGAVGSKGYNVITMNLNCVVSLQNNYVGFSPGLDAFDYHGGATKTISLKSNSIALDTGNPDGCKYDTAVLRLSDQRTYTRIADGNNDNTAVCDIGAFESQASPYVPNCASAPAKPSLFTPANGAELSGTQTLLSFDASCADTYSVVIRQDSKQGTVVEKGKNLTLDSYLTGALAKGHTYYWRVEACNANGCAKSAWGTFSIKN